jgi:septum formation protein
MVLFFAFRVKSFAARFQASSLGHEARRIATLLARSWLPTMLTSPKRLVLASTSPYRRELLSRLQIDFSVANPETDESALPDETPDALAVRLSEAKARAVSAAFPDALIIGSDQVAYMGDEIFGKPGTHDKAAAQLRKMSGKTVTFATGLCLFNAESQVARTRLIPMDVTFRTLDDLTIERYLRREQPYNCAGSAKSEGLGIALIARMRGDDPNALVGLPLMALCELLAEENFRLL